MTSGRIGASTQRADAGIDKDVCRNNDLVRGGKRETEKERERERERESERDRERA